MSVVFLAISRTGGDPCRHDLYEIAAISRRDVDGVPVERAYHWIIRPERLASAEVDELVRGRYYDRSSAWEHNGAPVVAIDPVDSRTVPTTHAGVARTMAKITLGAQLATLGIDRDGEFLREFLRAQREPAPWVGELDVTAAACGAIVGYSQGWAVRGRADHALERPAPVDLASAVLPLDPYHLARALGAAVSGDPVSALTRAYLTRALWDQVMMPLTSGEHSPDHLAAPGSAAVTTAMPSLPRGVDPLTSVDQLATLGRPVPSSHPYPPSSAEDAGPSTGTIDPALGLD